MDTSAPPSPAVELARLTGHTVRDCEQVLTAAGDDLDRAKSALEYAATQDSSRWAQVSIASRMARRARLEAGAGERKPELLHKDS